MGMGREKFGGLLDALPEREPSNRGRGVKEISHTEETEEEAVRLRGGTRRKGSISIEDMPDIAGLAKTPEELALLREAIREALVPTNKNYRAIDAARNKLMPDIRIGKKPRDSFDARAMEVHSGKVKTVEAESAKRAEEARKATARTAELRKRSRGKY